MLEDDFDFENNGGNSKKARKTFVSFTKQLRKKYPELELLPLGAGSLSDLREKCTYPDAPAVFPSLKARRWRVTNGNQRGLQG